MITKHTQSHKGGKSCGAACALVARAELGDGVTVDNKNEMKIYNSLKIPSGKLGEGEILPSSIAKYMQKEGHKVEFIESPLTKSSLHPKMSLTIKAYYAEHEKALVNHQINRHFRDPKESDLHDNARLFLVLKFEKADKLHYVLARRGDSPNQGKCYIMNPDPGENEQIGLPMAGNYFKTNIGGHFSGFERRYRFLGIAIRVW